MKLIREINEQVQFITESSVDESGKKSLFITGPFLQTEVKNRNGRIYKKDIMAKEVGRYVENYVNKNRAYGELGHPDTPTINLDRVSHMIVELKQEGNDWIGKAKILDTPMGNIARNLIEGGGQLGVSSRGMGSLKQENGANIVQDDFYLATAADIVADPSAPDAFVRGIMENKEWMLVGGVWTPMDLEIAQKQIKKASRREIEAVSIQIFENFIKRL
jgi:Prohead core protein serine protease